MRGHVVTVSAHWRVTTPFFCWPVYSSEISACSTSFCKILFSFFLFVFRIRQNAGDLQSCASALDCE